MKDFWDLETFNTWTFSWSITGQRVQLIFQLKTSFYSFDTGSQILGGVLNKCTTFQEKSKGQNCHTSACTKIYHLWDCNWGCQMNVSVSQFSGGDDVSGLTKIPSVAFHLIYLHWFFQLFIQDFKLTEAMSWNWMKLRRVMRLDAIKIWFPSKAWQRWHLVNIAVNDCVGAGEKMSISGRLNFFQHHETESMEWWMMPGVCWREGLIGGQTEWRSLKLKILSMPKRRGADTDQIQKLDWIMNVQSSSQPIPLQEMTLNHHQDHPHESHNDPAHIQDGFCLSHQP